MTTAPLYQALVPCLSLLLLSGCRSAGESAKSKSAQRSQRKPNIIYILADDLGYGELGCYGQTKIETPNIDRLRSEGMKFTQHYSGSPVCAPSRCVLMTGRHSGHAYIRGNDEWRERGDVWSYAAMNRDPGLEGQRPIPAGTVTVASLLKSAGYATACVGKWGLGAPGTEGVPNRQGFDLFFGYNCQRQAHTLYPCHLWRNDERVPLRNREVAPGTKLAKDADPLDESGYADYTLTDYAPEVMFAEITRFVHASREQPFFLYWATPIPHVPLQAPRRWLEHYVKKFGDEAPYTGDRGYFPCRYPRATYAAMVSYLDENVGRLVAQLKTLGVYDNTLIIFTSDNGASFNGGTDSLWFDSGRPFSSERGRGKGSLHEGGIRVPFIASWPEKIRPGSESDHISAFWDALPTLCEVAGLKPPADSDGISYLPTLLQTGAQRPHPYLYWEYPEAGASQAVRIGQWKALRKNIAKGNRTIALFNLESDIREERDVAAQNPEIVASVETIMQAARTPPALERFRLKTLDD